MPQFFMNKRLIILLVSTIILVALIGFSLGDRKELTWPEQFVKDTTGWVQTLVSKPVHFVAGLVENVQDLQNTYEQNKELKSKLEEMAQQNYEIQQLRKENEQLKDVLDEKATLTDYELTVASVIRRNSDQWNELVTINKGENDGVKKNMAVISAAGLVGKVKSVASSTATVQLLSSELPTNRVSAYVQKKETDADKNKQTDVFGIISDYDEKDTKNLIMTWEDSSKDIEIEKGQLVTTSGLGGVFPAGLAIGTVSKVEPDKNGLEKRIFIEPAADFYDLSHVMVVKSLAHDSLKEEDDQ